MRKTLLCLPLLLAGCVESQPAAGPVDPPKPPEGAIANRPKVPGTIRLTARQRKETAPGSKRFAASEKPIDWAAAETAIVICDMWDDHYCKSSAQRVGVMVPRMNEVITHARSNGVMIIHAPSDTMTMYADTPYRKRMQQAKGSKPPVEIGKWCDLDPAREPPLPVDTSKCACDDPVVGALVRKYSRQHPGLDITGYDGVSDNGQEIYNFCKQEGIKNVAVMGVHTNMCVLGRSFGIRQLVKLGFNVVLVRDLTDAMYDPRQPPFVSHARGTELIVEHIETYWTSSADSRSIVSLP